ncbi:MAG: TIGR01212 family radical SAM protein [Bacteroidales bacterium]|nr:TIGR01212 family radical SAM protein [Bacteroidales bacterium]
MAARYGGRVQKLSVDAGFSCPNRDGTIGTEGCSFCTNSAFTPSYCNHSKSITQQLDEGIAFHRRRYRKTVHYVAYFQPHSNTYADLSTLRSCYAEALNHPFVRGLAVGTRPDCVDDAKLDLLARIAADGKYVAVEYGIESCYDTTLALIGRGHDFACSRRAVEATAARGLHCAAHFILGLPGEDRDAMLAEADIINAMPLGSIKLHQLQLLKGTRLAAQVAAGEVRVRQFSLDEYVELVCDLLERLRPDMAIERLAGEVPPRYQACPERSWRRPDGSLLRNEDVPALVEAELERRNTRQGSRYV